MEPIATSDGGVKFACPKCGQHISASADQIGMSSQCPTCDTTLIVPEPQGVISNHEGPESTEKPSSEKLVQGFAPFLRTRKGLGGILCLVMIAAVIASVHHHKTSSPPVYEQADASVEGLARARIGDRWGYIDQSGQFVIPPTFFYAGRFKDGFAKVMKEGGWGFIDKTGRVTSKHVSYDDPTRPEAAEKGAQLEVAERLTGDDGYTNGHVPEWQAWSMLHTFLNQLPPETASDTLPLTAAKFPTESEVLAAIIAKEANKDDKDAFAILERSTEAPIGTYKDTILARTPLIVGGSYASGFLVAKDPTKARKLLVEAKQLGDEQTQHYAETFLALLDNETKN